MDGFGMMRGVRLIVQDAQRQQRTARDVKGPWVRPKPVSKARGRKGTRRRWKTLNPPHRIWLYREPEDMLRWKDPMTGQETILLTPIQDRALTAALSPKNTESEHD